MATRIAGCSRLGFIALTIALVMARGATAKASTRESATSTPIVLAHGISGFSNIAGIDYFYEVPATLRAHGYDVHVTSVPPWATVEARARHLVRQLREVLRKTGARRIHIIAHSMGGLDARRAIQLGGLGDRVASLTTMGTPHRGSPIADMYSRWRLPLFDPLQSRAADVYAWAVQAPPERNDLAASVYSLSTSDALRFNAEVTDDPRVAYYSFAGRTLGHDGRGICDEAELPNPREVDFLVVPNLAASAAILSGPDPLHPIPNDGLVQVHSARWGRFMGCIPSSHFGLVGHPARIERLANGWDHRIFYVRWAEHLTRSAL